LKRAHDIEDIEERNDMLLVVYVPKILQGCSLNSVSSHVPYEVTHTGDRNWIDTAMCTANHHVQDAFCFGGANQYTLSEDA